MSSRVHNTKEFIEKLWETNDAYINGEFSIMSTYINSHTPVTVKDKYGLGLMRPNNLLSNRNPSIKSAYNKTEYFIAQAKELHRNKYDYSKVEFISNRIKVTIICPDHGEFEVTPNKHLSLQQGCVICSNYKLSLLKQQKPTGYNFNNWLKSSKESNNFDSYKLYFIRCWDDEEEFYKIGITYRKLDDRFSCKTDLPYQFEVLKVIENSNARFIWDLEKRLKRINRENKYIPKKEFKGMYECIKRK